MSTKVSLKKKREFANASATPRKNFFCAGVASTRARVDHNEFQKFLQIPNHFGEIEQYHVFHEFSYSDSRSVFLPAC